MDDYLKKGKQKMDDVKELEMQLADHTASLYKEGFVNDAFKRLNQLKDENRAGNVVEVVFIFFEECERLLDEMYNLLFVRHQQENVDFKKLDAHVGRIFRSSLKVGARRVNKACLYFARFSDGQDIQGCLNCLKLLRSEFVIVKGKLETLFKLEKQVLASKGIIRHPTDKH